jgi:hypothetical protein
MTSAKGAKGRKEIYPRIARIDTKQTNYVRTTKNPALRDFLLSNDCVFAVKTYADFRSSNT